MFPNKKYYGLLKYDNSYNLGDEIQSIAAKSLLPNISSLIDRDTSSIAKTSHSHINLTQEIRIIYNGWFDGQYCQFPPPNQIEPLFISFHINETDHSDDKTYQCLDVCRIQDNSIMNHIDYLKKYEPIGCRDYHTMNILTKKGIACYFSGCLTLTLQNPFNFRNDEILVVDAHLTCKDTFHKLIPQSIRDQAIYISQAIREILPHEKKMELAQQFLDRLAKARLVITSRLHTTLPCLAYKTPVIFIHDNLLDVRFEGLLRYMKAYTRGDQLDVDLLTYRNPVNPELETIQRNLRLTVNNWIGRPSSEIDGNSIICACMDRNHHLEKSLPTWINANPDEIIIIDWGSKTSIRPIIEKYNQSNKIILITISGVDQWILTRPYNLAAKFAKYRNILKLDCDSKLDKNFFQYHNLGLESHNLGLESHNLGLDSHNLGLNSQTPVFDSKVYFAGDWKLSRNENESHTNGIIYAKRSDFFKAGGYNELITTYGYDDCDLYNRLNKYCRRLLINLDCVQHILHSNHERFEKQLLGYNNRLDIEIEKNRLISEMNLWNNQDYSSSTFEIIQEKDNPMMYNGRFLFGPELSEAIQKETLEKAIKNRSYQKPQKKNFYINVKNGLGNRLRALASAYNIAKSCNRKLVVIWVPDNHCGALFTDLYKVNYLFKDVTIIEQEFNPSPQAIRQYNLSEDKVPSSATTNSKNQIVYDYTIYQDQLIDVDSHLDIYVISSCVLNSPLTNWYKESVFLKYLEPIDDIALKIYEFEITSEISKAIGIHIRMGQPIDCFNYEDTAQWNSKSRGDIEIWRKKSHYSTFLGEMDRITKLNPKQTFFLCCDNDYIYNEIINLKKYNIISFKKDVYDRSQAQIKTAVIDLALLSKTQYILGSNWSSFTEIAHRIHGGQLKLAGINF
jgi:hypothetical protein